MWLQSVFILESLWFVLLDIFGRLALASMVVEGLDSGCVFRRAVESVVCCVFCRLLVKKSLLCRMSVLIGEAEVKGFWLWKYIVLCRIRNILYRLLFYEECYRGNLGKMIQKRTCFIRGHVALFQRVMQDLSLRGKSRGLIAMFQIQGPNFS